MPNGKGSARRPAAVDDAKVRTEWERIFRPRHAEHIEIVAEESWGFTDAVAPEPTGR